MKKRLLFIIMTVLIFFAAFSSTEEEEEVTPHDRFDAYIELWNNQEFTKMYERITEESSADYPTEAFIDRYEKIYEDLDLKNINISYTELSEEDLDEAMEIGEAVQIGRASCREWMRNSDEADGRRENKRRR